MNAQNYTRDQFLAFVMLYAAHIDVDFSKEEKEFIKERVSPDEFNEIYGDFNDMSDYESLQHILTYKERYFATEEDRERVLVEIKTLFFADGQYSSMEKEMYHFIEKLTK